ncbi:PPOX class probable F420-dependent enzyme, Rv2061 family [Mycobacteroides abscessus subsp. abscessus]|nr:PPOX class probable F420-dependent enzyme, Rv2061 family [Mycobacteroides abscessus subsp. abscessus]
MTDWDVVGRANYVSFTSYRKDGTAVSSPVWIAPADGKLYPWSTAPPVFSNSPTARESARS